MAMNTSGMIFDIQHFSLHDGPGVRSTVFFKGCPLSCKWCCNPESQHHDYQIMYYQDTCTMCGKCIATCPHGALSPDGRTVKRQKDKCQACGQCITACKSNARTFSGRLESIDDIYEEVREHWRIFMQSGGGITCSGGEALNQPAFLKDLLIYLHDEMGFHTCLDTSGYAFWETLETMLPHLDLVLLDIKHMDNDAHKEGTGVGNATILDNATRLGKLKFPVVVRLPLIPRFNDSPDNLEQMGNFLNENGFKTLEILPYHEFALSKYNALQMDYHAPKSTVPATSLAVNILRDFGIDVTVHGE
jgi:pyruvate formate lyase activating enzyme